MAEPASIWLVRHGETEWSASGQHTSFTDLPLTDVGKRQAARLFRALDGRRFSLALTSPMIRARETCHIAGYGDDAEVTDLLAEWNYGEYEGRTTAEIRTERPGWTIFDGDPPGGETAAEIAARATRLLGRVGTVTGDVALFAHAHVLRVVASTWLGCGVAGAAHLVLGPATISVLGHEREARVIERWNDGSFLRG